MKKASRKSSAHKQRAKVAKLLQCGKTIMQIARTVKVSRQRVHAVIENLKRSEMSLHSGTMEKCESGPYTLANHIGMMCRAHRLESDRNLADVIAASKGVFSLSELSNFERGLTGMPSHKLRLLLKILRVEMVDVWPGDYDSPEDLATWLSVTVDELIDMVMFVTKLRR